ncbi:phosphotransferase [Dactylosporangium roseum]|uniref:Phosphotransferase n=1 Tax=Dactylosporangium roseum TaxID=47989 RepID=A0ABY5Z2B3_9ACTN|nr:phosphotransferase [Dactylosporangium roseum]UWZ35746.1 phosphotransferase [Dactylosporangium roseum]
MVDWPELPAGIVAGIEKRWPDHARAWAADVETELREICDMYDAKPRTVLPARYGFVVAVDSPHGGLVLRSSPDPDASIQADVASALADLGVAPVVHETILAPSGLWMVLEEVQPGTPLALTDRSTVDLNALAAPFAAMLNQPAPRQVLPSVFDWLRERLKDDNLTDMPVWREGPAPLNERQEALGVLDELAQDTKPGLCHGDASTWNLLTSGDSGWKIIDPRGVSGEIGYDLAVIALKLRGDLPPADLGSRLAKAAGTDWDRVKRWISVAEAARV